MIRCAALVAFMCVWGSNLARADALIQSLPPDGSWISFHVNLNVYGQQSEPIWTIRSVGKKAVDGEVCRWIELHSRENDKTIVTYKLLIPEKEFGMGKNPLGKAKTVWTTNANETAVKEISSIAEVDPPFAMVIEGPTADVKKREKKESIPWQNGSFDCDVFEGKNSQELFGNKSEIVHTVWKHQDVPFGLAAMKQTLKVTIGDQSTEGSINIAVKEFGKDAKSALPEVE